MAIIIKLKDNKFEGKHPNVINEGFEVEADIKPEVPLVGFSYVFGRLRTSDVIEILESSDNHYKFKTRNSTYIVKL